MKPLLTVEDLKKHYPIKLGGMFSRAATLKAVDGVSFAIAAGKTLGLVGESGCGKSTTARLVLGVTPSSSGKIEFEGKRVEASFDRSWRAQRRRMQMVYQDPLGALDRRLSVGVQVLEPLVIHGIGDEKERLQRTRELFSAVGLRSDLFDRYPHELSGGQRQRVVIARALILEPSLIVCDEPISALDVSVAAQVINLLADIQNEFNVSYLFISHDLKVVRQLSHEVAVMYLGKIVERGDPELIFGAPMHPYTQALVSAIPTPRRRNRTRILLSGDPPNPMDIPNGCPFHPRCAQAMDTCQQIRPRLGPVSDGRLVSCHLVPTTAAEVEETAGV
ncbi:peptide/nickel transport system ATP-binding protein [Rhizobiales bacterium GAS113]|nr:peptide/nickel transport system ATP-binding protein [Rhizobiales bacterium GAS113]